MRNRIAFAVVAAAAALLALAAGSAYALGVQGVITGTAGIGLDPGSNPSFTDTLDGTDQTVTYKPTLGVSDARGTGNGWHLTESATALSDGAGHSLIQQISAVAQACHAGSTCSLPTSNVTLPVAVGTAGTSFYSSATNYGLGKVDVTPTVSVAIPGNSYAGTYTSTVTFAAVAGP
jgi:hypothetical protein